jgi:hypothetical protein
LAAAEAAHRPNEAFVAQALLARCALQRGERSAALAEIERLQTVVDGNPSISARTRAAISEAVRAAGAGVPTPAPTMFGSDSL